MSAFAYRFKVAYDGGAFSGWQRQPNARTVQTVLSEAASAVLGHETLVRGASRTDAGVHAMGQAAACDADGTRTIPPRGFVAAMNARLPADVAVREAEIAEVGYDPRFDALEKTYRYLVHLGEPRDPLIEGRAWFLDAGTTVSASVIDDAARALVGTHDFSAFRAADDERPTSVRTISRIDVRERAMERDDVLAIEVTGTAFMKNMVRIVVGTLVEVGLGRRDARSVAALLSGGRREDAGRTAPAHGLYLVRVVLGRTSLGSPEPKR